MGSTQKPATCGICFEQKLPIKETVYKKRTNCTKFHPFCRDCIATHILYRIKSKTAVIRCPGVECSEELNPVKCRSLISADAFVDWCDVQANVWLARKGHKRALCPYNDCSELVIDECKISGAKQKCPKCKREFCFGCSVKWERNHHEVCKFEELVFLNTARQKSWKKCPYCRFFVERTEGCNRITCRCGTAFCYKCGLKECRCRGFRCLVVCFECVLRLIFIAGIVAFLYFFIVKYVTKS